MASDDSAEQASITRWFDEIYRRKGERYLRPAKAYYIFLELLQAKPDETLLDVACGLGRLLDVGSEYGGQLYGLDISAEAVARAKVNAPLAQIRQGNAEHLPYADEFFCMVTCLGALERMIDVRAALAEMRRVGRADARYCFLVRNANTYSWNRLARNPEKRRNQGHQGAETLQYWRNLFETSGFKIVNVLPDQYPLQLKARWAGLFLRPVDYRQPRTTRLPLESANEFIFILEKCVE